MWNVHRIQLLTLSEKNEKNKIKSNTKWSCYKL